MPTPSLPPPLLLKISGQGEFLGPDYWGNSRLLATQQNKFIDRMREFSL